MKHLIALSIMVLFAQVAYADSFDTQIILRNGSAQVWDNVVDQGDRLCTKKAAFGFTDCILKVDITSIKKVDPGTVDAREIGGADTAGLSSQSDGVWAAGYDEKAENAKKNQTAADDRARSAQRARDVKKYGEDEVTKRERSGNSVR